MTYWELSDEVWTMPMVNTGSFRVNDRLTVFKLHAGWKVYKAYGYDIEGKRVGEALSDGKCFFVPEDTMYVRYITIGPNGDEDKVRELEKQVDWDIYD